MNTGTARPAATVSPGASKIHSAIRPAEALVFLSSLLNVTDDSRQRAIYDLLVRESPLVELKLEAWTQALSDIPTPDYGRSRLWDRKQRTFCDIQELKGIIRLLRRQKTPSSVMRFFCLIYRLWSDLLLLSSLPRAAHVLTDSHPKIGPSTEYRNYGSSVIEEANWLVDFLYCSLVSAMDETKRKLPAAARASAIGLERVSPRTTAWMQSR